MIFVFILKGQARIDHRTSWHIASVLISLKKRKKKNGGRRPIKIMNFSCSWEAKKKKRKKEYLSNYVFRSKIKKKSQILYRYPFFPRPFSSFLRNLHFSPPREDAFRKSWCWWKGFWKVWKKKKFTKMGNFSRQNIMMYVCVIVDVRSSSLSLLGLAGPANRRGFQAHLRRGLVKTLEILHRLDLTRKKPWTNIYKVAIVNQYFSPWAPRWSPRRRWRQRGGGSGSCSRSTCGWYLPRRPCEEHTPWQHRWQEQPPHAPTQATRLKH